MENQVTINDILSLEAYFKAGLDRATGLRKRLEKSNAPASPKGLSEEVKAEVHTALMKKVLKKKK